MALYGVALDINMKRINLDFKLKLAAHQGSASVRNLERVFQQFDSNGNGKLDLDEFTRGLNAIGLFLKKTDYQTLLKYYDQNGDGLISFEEFVSGIREPLNERRRKLVNRAFTQVDTDKNNVIVFDEIAQAYNTYQDPAVQKGKKTGDQALRELFAELDSNADGQVSLPEWEQYFTDINVGYPSDQQFVKYFETFWGVREDEYAGLTKEEAQHAVKAFRFKLIQSTQGTHEEFLLRKLFNEFDINKNGTLNIDELYAMTIKLEIPISKAILGYLFKKFDRNGNGVISFEEFVAFVVNDPYPI